MRLLAPRAAEAHQQRLLDRADRSANAAERAVRKAWKRLLAVIEGGGSWPVVFAAAQHAIHSLPAIAEDILADLTATVHDAARWTAKTIAEHLPETHRQRFLQAHSLLEDDGPRLHVAEFIEAILPIIEATPAGHGDARFIAHVFERMLAVYPLLTRQEFDRLLWEASKSRDITLSRIDLPHAADLALVKASEMKVLNAEFHFVEVAGRRAAATTIAKPSLRTLEAELLLPALRDEQIHAVVYAAGWMDRIRSLTKLAEPEMLAARIASAVQQGQSVAQIRATFARRSKMCRPSARRVARTAGLWVAHEAELHTYEQLGDLIEGYTVRAVLDRATRPEHRKRDGTRYFRAPKSGQLGFDAMPRPPRESPKDGGKWAFNCRCWLDPILRE